MVSFGLLMEHWGIYNENGCESSFRICFIREEVFHAEKEESRLAYAHSKMKAIADVV